MARGTRGRSPKTGKPFNQRLSLFGGQATPPALPAPRSSPPLPLESPAPRFHAEQSQRDAAQHKQEPGCEEETECPKLLGGDCLGRTGAALAGLALRTDILTLSTPQPSALPLPASLRPCPATTAPTSPGQRAVGRMGAVWARAFEASAKASWKPAAGVGAPTRFAGRHPPVSRVSQLPSHASGPPATFERETLGFSPVPSPCIHQCSPPCRRPSREDPAGSLAGVARPSPLPPPRVLLPQVPG